MSEYILYIPDFHPVSLNRLMGVHWAIAAKRKKADLQMIWGYAKQAKIPPAKSKRIVELTIILGPKQKAGDPDAYFKGLNDALVNCGLLVDDNRQGVELPPVKFERGERKATRILLRDAA